MDPIAYSQIGYDKSGTRLNETDLVDILQLLAENPNGAIITKDIAEDYELSAGDTFKAFKSTGDIDYFSFSILAIVDVLTQPLIPDSTYFPTNEGYSVGTRKIWVNQQYISEKLDIVSDTHSYATLATYSEYNDTAIALGLLESGGEDMIYSREWDAVDLEVDSFLSTTTYQIDRSVDSMLTIASLLLAIGVLMVYTTEGLRNRKREVALLKSLGAETGLIARLQVAELLFLVIATLSLIALYSPIFIVNSLFASIDAYTSWNFRFPIMIFPIIPWTTLLTILSIFLVGMSFFIGFMAPLSSKVNLAEALDSTWTLGGPSKEEDQL